MLINQTDDMYWTVGNNIFYNKLLAADESKTTGLPLKFYFYNKTLDKFSFSQPINWTWDELLKQRALEIREKHEKLRLWFSGGRDSYLILDSFTKHNIVIDEIITIDNNYKKSEYSFIFDYLTKNKHLHPNVKKFTQIKYDDKMCKQYFIKNWRDNYFAGHQTLTPSVGWIAQYLDEPNTGNITGCEKSKTYTDAGKIYSYMYDATVEYTLGTPSHEPFFISSTVPIFQFQVQHIANYIKDHLTDWSESDLNGKLFSTLPQDGKTIWDPTHPYYIGCIASLRTSAAKYELGVPWAKFNSLHGTNANSFQYDDIENELKTHYPDLHKNFINGALLSTGAGIDEYFQDNDALRRFKPTSSERYFVSDR